MPRHLSAHVRTFVFFLTSITCSQAETTHNVSTIHNVGAHPRILFPQSAEADVHQRIQKDPLARDLYKVLLQRADHTITLPVCIYDIPDGKRLLSQSRNALYTILHTSMAWRLSGEKKYLTRTIEELDAACGLKDWNPSHFLDTAEMSTAVAIGYDWLYHELSEEQRKRYATALRIKGLEPARKAYTDKKKAWWTDARNNWAQVCATGLLFAERALEKQGDPIHPARVAAAQTLRKCRDFYTPSGAYPEGPGYWYYGSNYHVLGLAITRDDHATLVTPTPPEFKTSPLFTVQLTGSTSDIFNFADSNKSSSHISAAHSWMAREFKDSTVCSLVRSKLQENITEYKSKTSLKKRHQRLFPLHLLWLPAAAKSQSPAILPLDSAWQGTQPIATFRTSWEDENALYFAIKGGYPGASHGHMDVGSFVMDFEGVRWVEDLGSGGYNMPGYFRDKRWNYFRTSNFSHNTLVIDGKLQNAEASPCPMTQFHSESDSASTSFDLTSAYHGQAKKVIRRCQLERKKFRVTLTDSITAPAGPVRWAIMTSADIQIHGKSVTLEKLQKKLTLTRNDNHGGEWIILDAQPNSNIEKPNKGMRILAFTAPVAKQMNLSITMGRP